MPKEAPPILLITPPPIDAKKWDKYCLEAFNDISPRTNSVARAYGERVKSVARAMDCLVVDAFSLLGGYHQDGETHYGLHLEDGLHLNELGNRLLYDVSSNRKCLSHDTLPFYFFMHSYNTFNRD